MMFSITPNFKIEDIKKDFEKFTNDIKSDAVSALTKTLKDLVDTARAKTKPEGGFNNITWNLRASIGGVIVKDHEIVETYFPQISKGDVGSAKGKSFAAELAYLADDGDIMLIFVAGEDYAYFVEAKDRDVISGTNKKLDKFFRSHLGK